MKSSITLGIIGALIVIMIFLSLHNSPTSTSAKQSAFDRVMESKTLRCGYNPYPPALMKDPNTGEMSGIIYDLVMDASKRLGITVEWAEEIGHAEAIEALKTGRLDAMCTPLWRNPRRAPHIEWSKPLYFSKQALYVRSNDDRFNDNINRFNSVDIRIAVTEGTTSSYVADKMFPEAEKLSLPQLTPLPEVLLNVAHKKADATIIASNIFFDFDQNNTGVLREAPGIPPLNIQGDSIAFNKGEFALTSMYDNTFDSFVTTAYMKKLFKKYNVPDGIFLVRKPEYMQ